MRLLLTSNTCPSETGELNSGVAGDWIQALLIKTWSGLKWITRRVKVRQSAQKFASLRKHFARRKALRRSGPGR